MSNEDSKRLKTDSDEEEGNNTTKDNGTTDLLLISQEDQLLRTPFLPQNVAFVFTNAEGSNDRLFGNKEQLAKISPVFEAMFLSSFKESSADEVPLPGKKISTFIHFLRLALPGHSKDLKVETAREILPLVREYQVQGSKDLIDSFLSDTTSTIWDTPSYEFSSTDLVANIIEAEEYSLEKYLKASITFAAKRKHSSFASEPNYDQISEKTRLSIADERLRIFEKLYDDHIWCEKSWRGPFYTRGDFNWRNEYVRKRKECESMVLELKEKFDFCMQ